ncbi:MAG: hypothetical protein ACOH2M_31430 [Cypionkella sp.]
MAVISLILGGTVGFISALIGLVTLDISLLAALGLWSGVGMVVAVALIMMAMTPKLQPDTQRQAREA